MLRELSLAASEGEEQVMQRLRAKAVQELVQSEKSYLRKGIDTKHNARAKFIVCRWVVNIICISWLGGWVCVS